MALTFKEACQYFKNKDFYLIAHMVVVHHMLKDFDDYDVTRHKFYILPVGKDFLHVAVIEHEYGDGKLGVQIRYTCAADDLLYGLRTKYQNGGSEDNEDDIKEIETLIELGNLKGQARFVRKRFRHGRTKAKVRAFFVMVTEFWRYLWK